MRTPPLCLAAILLLAAPAFAQAPGPAPATPAAPIGEGAFDELFQPGQAPETDAPAQVEAPDEVEPPRRHARRQDRIDPPLPVIVREDEPLAEPLPVKLHGHHGHKHRAKRGRDRFVMRVDRRALEGGRLYYSSWVAACERRFPGFDARSGTIIGEDGALRRCE